MAAIIKTNSDVLAAVIRSARDYVIGPPQPAHEPRVDLAALERRLNRRPKFVARAEEPGLGRPAPSD